MEEEIEGKKILLGLGDEGFNEVVKGPLHSNKIAKVVGTVHMRRHIIQRAQELNVDMVFLGDQLTGDADNDQEWLNIVDDLRRFNFSIRIIFLCDRPSTDLFLTKLSLAGVTDIFNENKLPSSWIEQLKNPVRFESTERFRSHDDEVTAQIKKNAKKKVETPEQILQVPHIPIPVSQVVQKEAKEPKKEIILEHITIAPRSIAVISLFPGSGGSVVLRLLAEYLAQLKINVGIMESPTAPNAWFELINAWSMKEKWEKENKGSWISWHATINRGETVPSLANVLERDRVKYIIRGPSEQFPEWVINDTAYMLAYSRSFTVLFSDVSGQYKDPRENLVVSGSDKIIVVASYDALRVERVRDDFKDFLVKHKDNIIFVMNKSTPRLERAYAAEMKQWFDTNQLIHVPFSDSMQELYMEGHSFWSSTSIKDQEMQKMSESINALASLILGEEVLRKLQSLKKGGLFDRISSFYKRDEMDPEADDGTA
jgi:hypothetical protein